MPSATTSRPRQTPRHRRKGVVTAQRILDAAEELFARRGYTGTTLRDVSATVGIRNPSLYNHFSSKDALYAAVLERGIRPALVALSEEVVRGRMQAHEPAELVVRMMRLLAERPKLLQLIQHEILSGGERLSPMLREWIRPIFARADEVIASGPASERWGAEQVPLLVIAMYNVMVGYFTIAPVYQQLNGDDLLAPEMLERQTQLVAELVTQLFGSPKPSAD
ncbi:MAG: TetR/AcrR family transcriptional regulator [Myxococcota bacterium]